MTDSIGFLKRRFGYAFVWSGLSKISATTLQLASIPVAIRNIGLETYAAYVTIFALASVPAILVMRHGPTLTGYVALARSQRRTKEIAIRFQSCSLLSIATAAIAFSLTVLLFLAGHFTIPAVASSVAPVEVGSVFFLVAFCGLVGALLFTVEDLQAGYQETHVTGIRSTVGNAIGLLLVFFWFPSHASILSYAAIMLVPQLALRLINMLILLFRMPEVFKLNRRIELIEFQTAFHSGFLFSLVAGAGAYAGNQVPILAAGLLLSPADTAAVAVMNRLCLSAFAFGSIFSLAMMPAFCAAVSQGKQAWLERILRRFDLFFLISMIVGVVAFGFLGPLLFRLFVSADLPQATLCFLSGGVYATLLIVEHFYLMLALSIGNPKRLTVLFLARAFLTGGLSWVACRIGFIPGIWLFASIAIIIVTLTASRRHVFEQVRTNNHPILKTSTAALAPVST